MNERSRRGVAAAALTLGLLLGACQSDPGEPPLAGATMGGPFTLTSGEGRRVSDRDFAGKYRLMYFGFTFCPDVCPVDLQTIGGAMRKLEADEPADAEKLVPIFVSVDPARDTPEVMRRYTANFHPKIVGLTGSEQEIAAVARRYAVYHGKGEEANGQYLVNHSRMVVLYGPEGAPIAIIPHDQGPDVMAAEIARWVR